MKATTLSKPRRSRSSATRFVPGRILRQDTLSYVAPVEMLDFELMVALSIGSD